MLPMELTAGNGTQPSTTRRCGAYLVISLPTALSGTVSGNEATASWSMIWRVVSLAGAARADPAMTARPKRAVRRDMAKKFCCY